MRFNFSNSLGLKFNRTKIIGVNTFSSFIVKGVSLILNLTIIPLTFNSLNSLKYGLWVTIFSIVSWFNLLDIGIGSGFRNKFSKAVSLKRHNLAKEYLKALYFSSFIISLFFLIIYFLINSFIDWNSFLNIPSFFDENIATILHFVFILFFIQMIFKNIATIYLSLQYSALNDFLNLVTQFLTVSLLYLYIQFFSSTLLSIAIIFMTIPLIINVMATYFFFKFKFKGFSFFSAFQVNSKYLIEVTKVGFSFFFIQIVSILIYGTSNIFISHFYGPESVTPYNLSFRLFTTIQVIFSIIITPYWAAFSNAHQANDQQWIKKAMKSLIFFWFIFSLFILIIWIVAPSIYKLWIGPHVSIPQSLSFQFALFVIINTWISIFSNYLYAIDRLKKVLIVAIVQLLLFLPLVYLFSETLNLFSVGVILAINISLLIAAITLPIETRKFISRV